MSLREQAQERDPSGSVVARPPARSESLLKRSGMASNDNPYSRHYWRLVDDPKFVEVYDDDHHYATWSRLLMIADQAWPASAHLPAAARPSSVKKLAEVGLLTLLPGGRYKLAGLDAERKRRSDHAQTASNARWTSPGNAPSIPQAMPSIEEHREAEQRQQADVIETYYLLTTRRPTRTAIGWLNRLAEDFGDDETSQALAACWTDSADLATLLSRAEAALGLAKHRADRAKPAPTPPPDDPAPEGDPTEGKRAWEALRSSLKPGRTRTISKAVSA